MDMPFSIEMDQGHISPRDCITAIQHLHTGIIYHLSQEGFSAHRNLLSRYRKICLSIHEVVYCYLSAVERDKSNHTTSLGVKMS